MDVITFPPVNVLAYENTWDDPMAVSVGASGAPRGSQNRPNRRVVTLVVSGIGKNGHGIGYIEALKDILTGQLPLVQIELLPTHWWGVSRGGHIGQVRVLWADDEPDIIGDRVALEWDDGGAELRLFDGAPVDGVAGPVGASWPYLDCTGGIKAGSQIAIGETITVAGQVAKVTAVSEGSDGTFRIWTSQSLPSGRVVIGKREVLNFRLTERPRAMQGTGAVTYEFNAVQVFDTDFNEALVVRNPWSNAS